MMDGTESWEPIKSCAFPKIIAGPLSASLVHRDDTVLAVMDIQPVTEGHTDHGTSLCSSQEKARFLLQKVNHSRLAVLYSTPSSKMVLRTVTPGPSQTRTSVSALATGCGGAVPCPST